MECTRQCNHPKGSSNVDNGNELITNDCINLIAKQLFIMDKVINNIKNKGNENTYKSNKRSKNEKEIDHPINIFLLQITTLLHKKLS